MLVHHLILDHVEHKLDLVVRASLGYHDLHLDHGVEHRILPVGFFFLYDLLNAHLAEKPYGG
jgi:hypothetical protein